MKYIFLKLHCIYYKITLLGVSVSPQSDTFRIVFYSSGDFYFLVFLYTIRAITPELNLRQTKKRFNFNFHVCLTSS